MLYNENNTPGGEVSTAQHTDKFQYMWAVVNMPAPASRA